MKGYVIGRFYDDKGRPTDALKAVEEGARQAELIKTQREAAKKLHPNCNSRWAQGKGMRMQGCISVKQGWRQEAKSGAQWDTRVWWLSTSREQTRRNAVLVLKRQVIQSIDSCMRIVPRMPLDASYPPKRSDLDGLRWMCLEKGPIHKSHTFCKRVRRCRHVSNGIQRIDLTALSCKLFACCISLRLPRVLCWCDVLFGLLPMELHTFLGIPMR